MPAERQRKPRPRPAPKPYKPQKRADKKLPKTSAVNLKPKRRNNLTLHDWLTVFAYIDKHPNEPQEAVVNHFRTQVDGALFFDQSTLSRKIKQRPELEARVKESVNALSSKRPRVVTRPDVERALLVWQHHMEGKGETVTGPMLIAKRQVYEGILNVPEIERL
ncbi:hypothetical protein F5887DRAFT_836221, partial [Amanita rubescens]